MTTEVLVVDANWPAESAVQCAAAVIRAGGLVAFPTETVYGLGANALDAEAVARIFAAKGRPAGNPLIVHVSDADGAQEVAAEWPDRAARLAARFWPGPLTLILPKRPAVPDIVTAGGPTVAVRAPAHAVAQALIHAAGVPIAAPSANRSTQVSATRAEHVIVSLTGRIDLILDGGPTPGGLESTVLDLTRAQPTLLRPGLIAPAEIEAVVGSILRRSPLDPTVTGAPLSSPGLQARHYAPRATLELADDVARMRELLRQGERVGWLTFRADAQREVEASDPDRLVVILMPAEPEGYSARLYAELHRLDVAGVTRIVVVRPPETDEWLAVHDRLQRAATPPS